MHRVLFPAIVVVALTLVGLTSLAPPGRSAAQPGTPGAGTPAPPPAEVCSSEELARGANVVALPPGQRAGVVTPLGSNDEVLFLVVVTLPPHSCLPYRERAGAVVTFVQEGTVVYTYHRSASAPGLQVLKGDSDGFDCAPIVAGCDTIVVMPDAATTLHATEWVTQDRRGWYTLRNSGDEDAVVSIAMYGVPPWNDDNCSGGCRGKP